MRAGRRRAPARGREQELIPLYAAALFLSAALLFTVQPMFARLLLPVLGGAPGVWSTAQVFFQVTLLAGYGYAHAATRLLGVRRHARAHLVVMILPLLALPLGLARAPAPPVDATPVPWLLFTMLITVGPPFFALSASGPLLQRWFSTTGHARAADPYFLYAASNLGSLLGLVAYPLIVEPKLSLRSQTTAWAWLYGLLAVLVAALVLTVRDAPIASPVQSPTDEPAPSKRRILRWVALAFVPSSLSLSATTLLTDDIASAPLLWIVPLALYLLTFVLAFARRPLVPHDAVVRAAPVAILLGLVAAASPIAGPVAIFLGTILAAFFVVALACHGELARDRPPPRHLTAFYFWVSAGGALGGAFSALAAPILFRTVAEYGVTLVAAAFVLPDLRPADGDRPRGADPALAALAGVAFGFAVAGKRAGFLIQPGAVLVIFAALGLFLLVASPRPAMLGASLGAVLLLSHLVQLRADGVLLYGRSFFGAFRVTEQKVEGLARRSLYHGATLHGAQLVDPSASAEPLSYYGATGPAGQLFLRGPIRPDAHIAVVGLGVGSLMAYAQPDQRWTFYEIDPRMVEIARDDRLFTFLSHARAPYDVVLGDARRSLSATTARYALIVLDAYSSDAVPLHLLTREAVAVYLSRLEERGLIALHVSNRHLDLAPVVAAIADALGLVCLDQNAAVSPSASARGHSSSHWSLLARRREDLGVLADDPHWHPPGPARVLWTDDEASLVQVWAAW